MYTYKVSLGDIKRCEVVSETDLYINYKTTFADGSVYRKREYKNTDLAVWVDTFDKAKQEALRMLKDKIASHERAIKRYKDEIIKIQDLEDDKHNSTL